MSETLKSAIIINPKSASGNTIRMWREIQLSLQRRLGAVEIFMTEYPGHSMKITRDLAEKKIDRLIVMGGDGSIHEVVNGLLDDSGQSLHPGIKIGVLNSGRGCDFIKSLEIPTDHNLAISKLVDFKSKSVDVGQVKIKRNGSAETHYFINSFSYGLGGQVAKSVQRSDSFLSPSLMYFTAGALEFFKSSPYELEFEINGQSVIKKECMNVFVMNGKYSGGGMSWAPKGKVDDGLLDLIILEKVSKFKFAMITPKVYDGTFVNLKEVFYQQVKSVKIKANQDLWVEMDGEVIQARELEISVIPNIINFIC